MKTAIALLFLCCLAAVLADMSISYSVPFSSVSTASNETIDFPTLNQAMAPASAAYTLGFNVSNPFSFVSFQDVYIAFAENSVDHAIDHLFKANISSSLQGFTGGYSDPCRFEVPVNQTVRLHYNATTDSADGQLLTTIALVSVGRINNNDQIQIQCPSVSVCTRFYYIDIDSPADDYLLNFTATRVDGDIATLTLAGGEGNCPTAWSPNRGVHVQQQVDDNNPLVVNNAQVSKTTRFWLQYYVAYPLNERSTIKFSYSVSRMPETPVVAPSSETPSGLPTWAYVLMGLGGLIVVGLIIFAAVKLSRKNKGGYTSV